MPYYEVTITFKYTQIVKADNEDDAHYEAGANLPHRVEELNIMGGEDREVERPADWEDDEDEEAEVKKEVTR